VLCLRLTLLTPCPQCGDLHLYAATPTLTLGTEHRGLQVAWSPDAVRWPSRTSVQSYICLTQILMSIRPAQVPPPAELPSVAPTPAAGIAGAGPVPGSDARGSAHHAARTATTPSSRLAAARSAGAGGASPPAEVHVSCRDVLLALSFYATRCDALLLGVAGHKGFVEIACRYEDPGMAPDAVALGIKLPVKDDGAAGPGGFDGGDGGGAGED
jgi:hypothetical protein